MRTKYAGIEIHHVRTVADIDMMRRHGIRDAGNVTLFPRPRPKATFHDPRPAVAVALSEVA